MGSSRAIETLFVIELINVYEHTGTPTQVQWFATPLDLSAQPALSFPLFKRTATIMFIHHYVIIALSFLTPLLGASVHATPVRRYTFIMAPLRLVTHYMHHYLGCSYTHWSCQVPRA